MARRRETSLRAFVAIEIPSAEVLDLLVAFQKDLDAARADLKLVERENLHFTVRFLGEVTQAEAAEVDRRLRGLSLPAADVEVRGVGAFPSQSRPRVVWVGVARGDAPKLAALAEPVIGSLADVGERDDRPFQPHLTVARVRSGENRQALDSVLTKWADKPFGRANLRELKLKSSVLTPKGPIYSDVGAYKLG